MDTTTESITHTSVSISRNGYNPTMNNTMQFKNENVSILNNTVPEGCIVLQSGFIPWDNKDNLISEETEDLLDRLKGAWFLPILFLVGGPSNVVNVLVFYRQGLGERINLCLFALSLADGLYLLQCMFLNAERIYTQFTNGERYGPMFQFFCNHNLAGFYGFTWMSQVMSAIIASERCFCILSPLRSQTLLQTRTMAIIIIVTSTAIVGTYFIVATRYRILCIYDPVKNTVRHMPAGGEFYFQHIKLINALDSVVYGVLIPGVSVATVIVTTSITAIKLRQAVARRAELAPGATLRAPYRPPLERVEGGMGLAGLRDPTDQVEGGKGINGSQVKGPHPTISPREVALTRMLICTSILFIVCVLPISLFRYGLFFAPELNTGRRYHNTFLAVLWVLEIVSYINSSFNFFVYYTMGSRYRETCREIFCTAGRKCGSAMKKFS